MTKRSLTIPGSRRRLATNWAPVMLVATAVALTTATLAGGARQVSDRPRAKSASPTVIRALQDDLLEDIQRGLLDSQIVEARIGPPPDPYSDSDDVRATPGATWIFYTIRARDHFHYKRGKWQALVVSGLLRDVGATRGLPPVAGHSFSIVWPDGTSAYDSSLTLYKPPQEPSGAASAMQVQDIVRRGASQVGVQVVDFRVSRPLGRFAPEITVRADDPRAFVSRLYENVWAIIGEINGETTGRPLVEGAYIETRNAAGALVDVSAYATRTRHGTGATNPVFGPVR